MEMFMKVTGNKILSMEMEHISLLVEKSMWGDGSKAKGTDAEKCKNEYLINKNEY